MRHEEWWEREDRERDEAVRDYHRELGNRYHDDNVPPAAAEEYRRELRDRYRDGRNFLGEAFRIANGTTLMLAQKEHLVAIIDHYRELALAFNLPPAKLAELPKGDTTHA